MKLFLSLSVLLLFFGCVPVAHLDPTADRLLLLDQYLSKQQFDKALAFLDDTSPLEPNELRLEKEKKIVLAELHVFEKRIITKALTQEKDEDWPGAKQTYDKALETAATSKVLNKEQQDMLLRFQGKMQALERQTLIVTGQCLQKKLPLLKNMHENDPESLTLKWRYSGAKSDAEEIGLELFQLGKQMLADNNIEMARRTLPLSAVLVPGPETEEAATRLDTILKTRQEKKNRMLLAKKEKEDKVLQAEKKRKQKNWKKKSQAKDKKNIEAFNNAMAYGKFDQARQHLSALSAAKKKTLEVELMQERLNKAIDDYVLEKTSFGAAFYRVGEYEMAIRVWQNIIALEPDNEIVKSKVERARLIVEKLEVLRERQEEE